MYDLKRLRPVLVGLKVRLGKDSDGGYVVLRDHLEKTGVLLSFGVAADWSFEEDFFRRRPGLTVHMFDASVSFPLIIVKFASKLAKLDFVKAGRYLLAALHYVTFIVLNDSVAFHRKFIAVRKGRRDVTFEDVLRLLGDAPVAPGSVFVKLDIEGGEYDLLQSIACHADAINGMVIEFHDLDRMGWKMEEVMKVLGDRYVVVHVHGNNFTGLVPGTALPTSLEVTLANRSLVTGSPVPDPGPYPHPGLDRANDPSMEDYQLNFSYVQSHRS